MTDYAKLVQHYKELSHVKSKENMNIQSLLIIVAFCLFILALSTPIGKSLLLVAGSAIKTITITITLILGSNLVFKAITNPNKLLKIQSPYRKILLPMSFIKPDSTNITYKTNDEANANCETELSNELNDQPELLVETDFKDNVPHNKKFHNSEDTTIVENNKVLLEDDKVLLEDDKVFLEND